MKRRVFLQAPAVIAVAAVVPSVPPSTGEVVSVRALIGKTHDIDLLPWNVWYETPDMMVCSDAFVDEAAKTLAEILDNEVMKEIYG